MPRGEPFNGYAKVTLIELVKGGRSPRSAADSMGFSWRTVKDHIDRDEEFRDLLLEAQQVATAAIEDKLYEEAKAGNFGAIRFWLSNRGVNWRDERDRQPGVNGAQPNEISVTVNLVGALREAMTQDDTRPQAIELARALPAASGD